MAVVITSKGEKFLNKIGIEPAFVQQLQQAGIKLALDLTAVKFLTKDGVLLAAADLPVPVEKLLAAGTGMAGMHALTKDLVHARITDAIGAVMHKMTGAALPADKLIPVPGFDKFGNLKTFADDMDEAVLDGMTKKPLVTTNGKNPIPLRTATQMYQRVNGTSEGSVYVVVAIAPLLNLAARIAGPTLAVRAEWYTGLPEKHLQGLLQQGFTLKENAKVGKYASVVMHCEKVTPERVLGAILLGCGIEWSSSLPNVDKVRQLCS